MATGVASLGGPGQGWPTRVGQPEQGGGLVEGFAGSVVGVTETLPLAVYAQLDVGLDQESDVGRALVDTEQTVQRQGLPADAAAAAELCLLQLLQLNIGNVST